MKENLEIIQKVIREKFEVNNLKRMLFEYLSKMEDGYAILKVDMDYELLVYNLTSQQNEIFKISLDDNFAIFQYKALYEYDIDFYYHIHVAIGHFKENDFGFTIDKCLALFKFNDDLSLYDVVFTIHECYKS